MSCSNCYNNCADITSDKCVKYTGVDIPVLGITNGDSLSFVTQAIVEFLTSTLDGTGIKLDIDQDILCGIVSDNLPTCSDVSVVDIVNALIKASCSLKEQINDITDTLELLNTPYTLGCFEEILEIDANTHTVVQAILEKVCSLDKQLGSLALDLETNYVKTNELNDLIDNHLNGASSLVSNKMVPWTAMEYYGTLSHFDITGKGLGDWDKIYLCNGNNGTPDKRGRVAVGTTIGMGGPAFNPAVDPAIIGNPTYSLQSIGGANNIILSGSQIPAHTHTATATVTEAPHFHYLYNNVAGSESEVTITALTYPNFRHDTESGLSYRITGTSIPATYGKSSLVSTGVSVEVVVAPNAGNNSHSNIQPVLACHYIIYIP